MLKAKQEAVREGRRLERWQCNEPARVARLVLALLRLDGRLGQACLAELRRRWPEAPEGVSEP